MASYYVERRCNVKERIKEYIISFLNMISYDRRHKKALTVFRKELEKYLVMPDDEFIMDYVDITSRYEHKKILLSTISVALITSVFMGIWKYVFDIISKFLAMQYTVKSNDIMIKAGIYVSITLGAIIFIFALLVLIDLLSTINKLFKKKIFLEEVQTIRRLREQ